MSSVDPNSVQAIADQMVRLRRDIHAHPELAFEETRTAALVAQCLAEAGIETHVGVGRTGVVGVLRRGVGPGEAAPCIALRADMDALPVPEANTFAHRSTTDGKMHACGHDGHTAMLLGAARWLARHGNFRGTVCFVFQPAEEGSGGAAAMLGDGLLERFAIERFYGLHNWPGLAAASMAVLDGPVMAAADEFEIVVQGKGAHGAMPHLGRDPVVAGAAIVQALQAIVSRQLDPLDAAVISVTRFNAGHASNVIPDQAVLGGTLRSMRAPVREALEAAMQKACDGVATAYGVAAKLTFARGYPATINDPEEAARCRAAARAIGAVLVDTARPSLGAEDFSLFALERPACYVWLGNGPGESGCILHGARYDFNDAIMATGIGYWVTLAESALPA